MERKTVRISADVDGRIYKKLKIALYKKNTTIVSWIRGKIEEEIGKQGRS